MSEASIKAAARAAIKAGMDGQYSGGAAKYDQFAAALEQAFYDAINEAGLGGGGGGAKKILYASQYPTTVTTMSSYPFTYWISFFDYSYFYANASYSYEAARNVPIPGPGNIVRVFVKTAQALYSSTADALFQLRKGGADVAGASITVPTAAPPDTIYDATGSWPFNDGDEMCLQADLQAAGACYIHTVGLVVEV